MKSTLARAALLSTAEVAQTAGVHRDTLLRWLREGLVAEPARDRRGWRIFSPAETDEIVRFAQSTTGKRVAVDRSPEVERLKAIDWAFADAKTSYLTHGLHPYPAKYIPQIPNALIQELSSTGETVGDLFCGSGTTLVEALLLKRNAIGIDANPLACLMTQAKTTALSDASIESLRRLSDATDSMGQILATHETGSLFGETFFKSSYPRPEGSDVGFWFDDDVVEELAEIAGRCNSLPDVDARRVALVAFSSIIVAVSRQDSDTRYVRREKEIKPGETLRRFARVLRDSIEVLREFTDICEPRFTARVVQADILSRPVIPPLDLVVCSPPYPNAYSYHLYHRTRMLWLSMDQPRFKREEIGSHRKYSSKGKNAATAETFRGEMATLFEWLRDKLRPGRHACFVIGKSTIAGETIDNAELLSDVARIAGFREEARIPRVLKATAKSFNPLIGRIKTEEILILRNGGMR